MCSPFTWPHFYLPPPIALPVCFSSICVVPLHFPFSLLLHRWLYLCSGLKQKSLNHIRHGSFARCYPLYRRGAAVLSLLLCFVCSFYIVTFISIHTFNSLTLHLILTQLSYTVLIIPPLALISPLLLHHHPGILSLINQLTVQTFSFLCSVNFCCLTNSFCTCLS